MADLVPAFARLVWVSAICLFDGFVRWAVCPFGFEGAGID